MLGENYSVRKCNAFQSNEKTKILILIGKVEMVNLKRIKGCYSAQD